MKLGRWLGLAVFLLVACDGANFGGGVGSSKAKDKKSSSEDPDESVGGDETPDPEAGGALDTEDGDDPGTDPGLQSEISDAFTGELGSDFEEGDEPILGEDGWVLERLKGQWATPADLKLVVAIDTSGSMQDAIDKVNGELPRLAQKFLKSKKNRMYLVGKTHSAAGITIALNVPAEVSARANYDKFESYVYNCDALLRMAELVEAKGTSKLPLNDKGSLHFLVLTDDNSRIVCGDGYNGIDVAQFKQRLDAAGSLPAERHFHGFIWTADSKVSVCGGTGTKNVGASYIELAASADYKGLTQNICQPESEWPGMVDRLMEEMRQTKDREYVLDKAPKDPSKMMVKIDGKVVGKGTYSYDEEANSIVFKKAPPDDAVIFVFYKT